MSDKYETIPSGIQDPNYRYKMIKMNLKQESRLNGVKTNIFNVEDIADDLRVPPQALMKWMSSELGANLEGSSIIKGNFSYEVMLKQLDKFIHRYVICSSCKYPELIMSLEGKKGLKSICKSCGKSATHDALHKAGKIMVQALQQGGKLKKQDIDNVEAVDDVNAATLENVELGATAEGDDSDMGGELTLESKRIDKLIGNLQTLMKEEPDITNEELVTFLQEYKAKLKLTDEFMHYIALCGVFSPSRNIVKYWDLNEELFIKLVKIDGKLGLEHFMQSLVLYFIRKYKDELSRFAPTFLKKLLDSNTIGEKYIQEWFDKTIRLDKDSMLYDKKAEKKFRDLVTDFVEWMKTAEIEQGDTTAFEKSMTDTGKDDDDDDQIQDKDKSKETDQQRKQRLAIEKQAKAQQEMLENLKKKHAENQATEMAEAEKRIDATKLDGDDNLDIDDI